MEILIVLFAAWVVMHVIFGRIKARSERGSWTRDIEDNRPRQAKKKVG
jgi:flagellar biogenesis protein FliO